MPVHKNNGGENKLQKKEELGKGSSSGFVHPNVDRRNYKFRRKFKVNLSVNYKVARMNGYQMSNSKEPKKGKWDISHHPKEL